MQLVTELKVWQSGPALLLSVYRMTTGFPQNERYGLISQLRRATLPVPTNIAEGSQRWTIVAAKACEEISELSRIFHGLGKKVEAAK